MRRLLPIQHTASQELARSLTQVRLVTVDDSGVVPSTAVPICYLSVANFWFMHASWLVGAHTCMGKARQVINTVCRMERNDEGLSDTGTGGRSSRSSAASRMRENSPDSLLSVV